MNLKFINKQHIYMNEFDDDSSGSESDSNESEEVSDDSAEEEGSDESEEEVEASEDDSEVEAGSEEELKEEVMEAIADGASEAEVKSMIKKFNLRVNGKDKEFEIDLSDEEAVKRELQKSMAFSEKAKEANDLKKTYQDALQELINDPIAALMSLGVNVDEISSKHILNKIEDEQKTPAQKEQEKLSKELADYRKKFEEMESKAKKDKEEQMMKDSLSAVEKELDEAWSKSNVVIPKNPEFIGRVISALDWAEKQVDEISGEPLFPNVAIADVLPLVEREYFESFSSVLDSAPEEALNKYNLNKAIKKQAEKKLAPKKAPTNVSNLSKASAKSKQISTESKESSEKTIDARDFFANLK